MGVEPEDADRIGAEPGEGAEAAVAVSRQHQRDTSSVHRLAHPLGQSAVELERGADLQRELAGRLDRTQRYVVSEIGKLLGKAAVDEVLGPASHAGAAVARVVGHLDDLEVHGVGLAVDACGEVESTPAPTQTRPLWAAC